MKTDEYKTKDIGEASALIASDVKILSFEREDHFFWFVFDGTDARRISDEYWSGDLQVNAKKYYGSYKALKDRIFSRQGGRSE